MKVSVLLSFVVIFCAQNLFHLIDGAMTLKQLTNSMDMMRQACAPKFKLDEAELYGLRKSVFPPDPDKELKCYTLCIAQMAGTMTKKGELSFSKTMAQIEAMVPPDLKPMAKEALTHCKDTQASFKDPCDRTYFSAKCAADFAPDAFMFP
ncbi:general odorant-binding protein lush-like [Anopheles bellator]|uniref:general odorant-binding protein lush-like n=1 Tax=Anopheles bellator TaxID=139047 RepID=UPI002648BA4A|nr:general odorant-binding protein lush-like [Anopheles bellator]